MFSIFNQKTCNDVEMKNDKKNCSCETLSNKLNEINIKLDSLNNQINKIVKDMKK